MYPNKCTIVFLKKEGFPVCEHGALHVKELSTDNLRYQLEKNKVVVIDHIIYYEYNSILMQWCYNFMYGEESINKFLERWNATDWIIRY